MVDAELAAQLAYYEELRRACAARPALHRAQLAALDAHLGLARRAPDVRVFSDALAHGGHATALARAQQLDRFAIDHAVAAAMGDAATLAAARAGAIALTPPGDAAFAAAIPTLAQASGAAATAAGIAEHASRLVEAAIDHGCDPDPARLDEYRLRARAAWLLARAHDPGFGFARLIAPPVRHRLPFADAAFFALRELVADVLGDPRDLDGTPPPTATGELPPHDVGAVATLALDGWPPAPPDDGPGIIARLDELRRGDPIAQARRDVTGGLDTEAELARASREPALWRLASMARAGVATARTPTEIHGWLAWHAAIAPSERRWWWLLAHTALWPAVAVMVDPGNAGRAARVVARLFGVEPIEVLRAPFVAEVMDRQLVAAGQGHDEDLAIAGPGGAHVGRAREASARFAVAVMEHIAARGGAVPEFTAVPPRFRDAGQLLAEVGAVLAAGDTPRGGRGEVVLWGTPVPLAAVDGDLAQVERPRLAGL